MDLLDAYFFHINFGRELHFSSQIFITFNHKNVCEQAHRWKGRIDRLVITEKIYKQANSLSRILRSQVSTYLARLLPDAW